MKKPQFQTAQDFETGDVAQIQQFLVDNGYLAAKTASGYNNVDGKRGPTTNAAIQAYLKDNPAKESTTNNFVKAFNNK